jgi:SNF2 family DNA or RNA helicase
MEESTLPFVIDNQQHTLSDVLHTLLAGPYVRSLDIATAYFTIGGWDYLQTALQRLVSKERGGSVRLLLGDEPDEGEDLGLRKRSGRPRPQRGLIRDLEELGFNERMQRLVESLIGFLRHDSVEVRLATEGFLHAKSYQCFADAGFLRIAPLAAVVGSSNFTRAGLRLNKELNVVHRADLSAREITLERAHGLVEREERQHLITLSDEQRRAAANLPGLLALHELAQWYQSQWEAARDFKDELIELLNASKFGRKEYTPYQIYTKALFEYFRDDLELAEQAGLGLTRSAVELSEFQEDAVKKARKILARYDGVMVADSVGLGKTWIGKKLLEDYAYHQRYKAVVICPAALVKLWNDELRSASIAAQIISQELLGRAAFDFHEVADADIYLIDESHNFRNPASQRYENLERILAAHERRGAISGQRKKLILLTATPINNSIFDLYHQVNLFTGGDRAFFAAIGIGDLQRYFQAARRESRQQESGIALYNLLEEVVIRRTRPFIKQAYPNATIQGQPIHWPERRLKTIHYNLEATYQGIYETVVSLIESLRLAPYRLEHYKQQGEKRDVFEEGREDALAGIFKSRYLKRFESSIEAFRISVRRALEFMQTCESFLDKGLILNSADFRKALSYLAREDEEDDATPGMNGQQNAEAGAGLKEAASGSVSAPSLFASIPSSKAGELGESEEARAFLETLPTLDAALYDLARLRRDVRLDIAALRTIWRHIAEITPRQDAKLARLTELLEGDVRGQKVLIFTYYKDTARYLYRQLCSDEPEAAAWRARAGLPHIRRMDSGADARQRAELVARFAPLANHRLDIAGSEQEIDIMISTDVLSEGHNLQDCGVLINYDLHWNPTRMIQRAGRIDRIGSGFETLWILNMFPDAGLEALLGLVESLTRKINEIDRSGLLDASVLGEIVHPQNFNTLRRIAEEDGSVVEEQEQFAELVSSEFLLQQLKERLSESMREQLENLPDGIHSGLLRAGTRGVFFFFTTKERPGSEGRRQHFWRYVDLLEHAGSPRIEQNRYVITNLIQCQPDTARYEPWAGEVDIFALQEQVIESILTTATEQHVAEEGPRKLEKEQQELATLFQRVLSNPARLTSLNLSRQERSTVFKNVFKCMHSRTNALKHGRI